jgi:hypothetical protein
MHRLFAVVVTAAVVVGTVARAMTAQEAEQKADAALVEAKIDARLRQLLVQARASHAAQE